MAVIYLAVTIVGAQSRGAMEAAENGGIAFAQIAQYYFGGIGLFILAATITLACLKTAVGLITSCSETFAALFPSGPKYRSWAIIQLNVTAFFKPRLKHNNQVFCSCAYVFISACNHAYSSCTSRRFI